MKEKRFHYLKTKRKYEELITCIAHYSSVPVDGQLTCTFKVDADSRLYNFQIMFNILIFSKNIGVGIQWSKEEMVIGENH